MMRPTHSSIRRTSDAHRTIQLRARASGTTLAPTAGGTQTATDAGAAGEHSAGRAQSTGVSTAPVTPTPNANRSEAGGPVHSLIRVCSLGGASGTLEA